MQDVRLVRATYSVAWGLLAGLAVFGVACGSGGDAVRNDVDQGAAAAPLPEPDYTLDASNTHNKFSSAIPAVLRVPSGSVVRVETKEATDDQFDLGSTTDDVHHSKSIKETNEREYDKSDGHFDRHFHE